MAVEAVFISSVVGGFEDVRTAAATAVSASGMYPIRSEELSADPASSRRALLDQVAAAEYYLLLFGARYGRSHLCQYESDRGRVRRGHAPRQADPGSRSGH